MPNKDLGFAEEIYYKLAAFSRMCQFYHVFFYFFYTGETYVAGYLKFVI
jgi:hypothetical protein